MQMNIGDETISSYEQKLIIVNILMFELSNTFSYCINFILQTEIQTNVYQI